MLNHIVLMGRLTRDPELRRTQSGTPVANFSIAVDREFGDTQTDFIDVVVWRQTAEFCTRYFNKGKMIVVSGRLQVRTWTNKEGQQQRKAEVVADNVYFADAKPKKETAEPEKETAEPDYAAVYDEDTEMPF